MRLPRATRRRRPVISTSQKPILYCVHLGQQCPHLPRTGVTQLSKIRADMLAHEDLFQCVHCGKRFGKVNGKFRHMNDRPRYCLNGDRATSPLSIEESNRCEEIRRARTYEDLKALALLLSNEAGPGNKGTNVPNRTQKFSDTAFSSPSVEPAPSTHLQWIPNPTNPFVPPTSFPPPTSFATSTSFTSPTSFAPPGYSSSIDPFLTHRVDLDFGELSGLFTGLEAPENYDSPESYPHWEGVDDLPQSEPLQPDAEPFPMDIDPDQDQGQDFDTAVRVG